MPDWIALDDYARRESASPDALWKRIREGQLSHREEGGLHYVRDREELARPAEGLVPSGYAEKAMASLLRLHDDLMDEKNARLSLLEKLSEKDQALAELKGHVRLLEEKLSRTTAELAELAELAERVRPALRVEQPVERSVSLPAPVSIAAPAPAPRAARHAAAPVAVPQPEAPHRLEGWRNW